MTEGIEPIDIKRNQRETCELLKEGIKEGIRKMLPMKLIIKELNFQHYFQNITFQHLFQI